MENKFLFDYSSSKYETFCKISLLKNECAEISNSSRQQNPLLPMNRFFLKSSLFILFNGKKYVIK